jgi:hypothetical protein
MNRTEQSRTEQNKPNMDNDTITKIDNEKEKEIP